MRINETTLCQVVYLLNILITVYIFADAENEST